MSSSDLIKTSRSDPKDGGNDLSTAFLCLTDLLSMVLPVAVEYAHFCGKAFRFEIEMKGMEKERDLVAATARAVNHFKKTNPNATCLEIIMFNGTPQDILRFAETRVQKTRMGGMLVGLGKSPLEQAVGAIDEDRSKVVPSSLINITQNPKYPILPFLLPSVQGPRGMVWDIDEYRQSLVSMQPETVASNPAYVSTYVLPPEIWRYERRQPSPLDFGFAKSIVDLIMKNLGKSEEDFKKLVKQEIKKIPAKDLESIKRPNVYSKIKEIIRCWKVERNRFADIQTFDPFLQACNPRMMHVLTDYPEYVTRTRSRLKPSTPMLAKPH